LPAGQTSQNGSTILTNEIPSVTRSLLEQPEKHSAIRWIDWESNLISGHARHRAPVAAYSNSYRIGLAAKHKTGVGRGP